MEENIEVKAVEVKEETSPQEKEAAVLEQAIESGEVDYKDIVTVFLAMQKQNFIMGNSLINLVKQWPKAPPTINEELAMFGILLETRD